MLRKYLWKEGRQVGGAGNRPLLAEFWLRRQDTFGPLASALSSLSQDRGKGQNQYHRPLRLLPTRALASVLIALPLPQQKCANLFPLTRPRWERARWSHWAAHSCHLVVRRSLAQSSLQIQGRSCLKKSGSFCTLLFSPGVLLSLESLPIHSTHQHSCYSNALNWAGWS